ncbi:TetR/AcrR family transcriptional regulator [Nocardia miyunensis]|uniref:TetR/AcrR family transcriptional regulator n=1 Tax=Nocardia miyunensis TaxID=282684 RepID=UPI000832A9C6|nr:TetR/AcrR family transcriptional regulator [Nocardia miyunensis]
MSEELSGAGSRGRPRDPRADESILRAALELFTEYGADATSIDQVAKRAGVARLTVYRRWPNKEALLIAALDRARDIDDLALYRRLLDTDTEPTELELRSAVTELLETIIGLIVRPDLRGLIARMIGTASSHPELLRTFWDSYLQPRRDLAHAAIARAIELGGLPPDTDPELLLDTVVGTALFPSLLHPDPPTEESLRQRVYAVLRQLGVQPPE